MRQIYYLSLNLNDEEFARCEQAVLRIEDVVSPAVPNPNLRVVKVPSIHEEQVRMRLGTGTFDERAVAAVEYLRDQGGQNGVIDVSTLFVVCSEASSLTASLREVLPQAEWGGAMNGYFACATCHEYPAIWHEMLHLLRVKDCYDENQPNRIDLLRCKDERCLMQYAPTINVVGDPPHLCEWTVKELRGCFEGCGTSIEDA